MPDVVIAAFYQFAKLPDFNNQQKPLLLLCQEKSIKGTILLAEEGINGTIAGSRHGIDAVISWLSSNPGLDNLEYKESYATEVPFYRMKIRLKKEIVTIGIPETDPEEKVGIYVAPEEWNDLISDPDVLVLDTRNDYEVGIGSFKNAHNPHTTTFRQFPQYVSNQLKSKQKTKIAMYCTGGIRCEKATSYMLDQGFDQVYHLKGGILNYLEKIPAEESLWEGECFVFDNRVAVNHQLAPGSYTQCHGCRSPLSAEDRQSPDYQKGVSCPHCIDSLTDEKRSGYEERQRQMELARIRNTHHIGEAGPIAAE